MDFFGFLDGGEEAPSDTSPVDPVGSPEPEPERPAALPINTEGVAGSQAVSAPLSPSLALDLAGRVKLREMEEEVLTRIKLPQRVMIGLIYRQLYVVRNGARIVAADIYKVWPQGKNTGNHPDVAEVKAINAFRAGPRPDMGDLQIYMSSEEFILRMRELGIEIDPDDSGLTAEQIGLLTVLADISDGRDLKRKLRSVGVSWNKFQVWLKEPLFKSQWSKLADDTLKNAIPVAKQQIASKMANGDMAAIKYGFELTGVYNPNDQKAVDAQQLVQIVLDVIEDVVKDQSMLLEIASRISLKSAAIQQKTAPAIQVEYSEDKELEP